MTTQLNDYLARTTTQLRQPPGQDDQLRQPSLYNKGLPRSVSYDNLWGMCANLELQQPPFKN